MNRRKEHLDPLAISLLVLCCLFWGLQQILIKSVVDEIPPLWLASLRMWAATVLLLVWCRARRVPLFTRDGTLAGGLVAGVLFAAEFCFIYLGLRDTAASRLTVFLYTSPFVVALLVPRFVPGERLTRVQWAGLVLAFAAVAVAFGDGFSHASPTQLRGDLFALGAALWWGLTTVVIRTTRMATASAEKTLFYQLAVTSVCAPLVSVALGEPWTLSFSAWAWTSLALQAGVGAFASYLTWMWLLQHYPVTTVSSFVFLTPMFALAFGVLLREALTLTLVVALAAVAVGIVLVGRRRRA
jgi:drug/metabolite transporter (DMT)-like permease